MLTEKDDDLLGVANRSDAMGLLAVWAVRGRDLVPHLTEQTTEIRGFQLLVEAFRLWEQYEPMRPEHAGRLDDFFLLIEQAFGRTVGWHDAAWTLPGARRVRARSHEPPCISVRDPDWHLLGGQKANGVWGLYRGAARRAGLLLSDMTRLSDVTLAQATHRPGIGPAATKRLFGLVRRAMDGETVRLPEHGNNTLTKDLFNTFLNVPLAEHLHCHLIDSHDINRNLAERLLAVEELNRRLFILDAANNLPEHRETIRDVIHCEDLLAVVENVFYWLCASKGRKLEATIDELPVDLDALGAALTAFSHSGMYGDGTAATRHTRIVEGLDTSSHPGLARSVLVLHAKVSKERKRAVWVWEDQGLLHCDVDVSRPSEVDFQVGVPWRNDYYLNPLMSITKQLARLSG